VIIAALGLAWYLARGRGEQRRGTGASPAVVPLEVGPVWDEVDNPRTDGWSSEVQSSAASARLGAFGEWIARAAAGDEPVAGLAPLVAEDFACAELVPSALVTAFDDGVILVERAALAREALARGEALHRGPAGLAAALKPFAERFRGAADLRVHFKVFRIARETGGFATQQHLSAAGTGAKGFLEVNAVWSARWSEPRAGGEPLLRALACDDYEQVTRRCAAPLLADCTASILGRNPSYREQFLHGLDHWLERVQDSRFFNLLGTPGLAVADVNNDGLDDLYVCQEGCLPNRLFLQRPDGSAADVSATSGADWLESSRSALLVDLDNDGARDLAVAALGNLAVARGDGAGRFALRALLPTTHDTMSLAAADYDLDGDLDLYVCAYKEDDFARDAGVLSIGAASSFVYHDSNSGAPNVLFRNEVPRGATPRGGDSGGEWLFTDVTAEVGLDANNRRFSFAAAWEDFDDDGDQDLYVANDFGRNSLYRNELVPSGAARFTDIAAASDAEDSASGMSVTWGDYDRDGRIDLYVSNMFSAAGSRVTAQAEFKPQAQELVRSRLRRFARGNTLLRNLGGGAFRDVSEEAAVTMGRWAWSSNFADLNGDGWDDLVVANGYITTEDPGDL
jgi:hypothetical protein